MRIIHFLLTAIFSFVATAEGQPLNTVLNHLTTAQWQEDVDYFARQLVKKHKNAFHLITEEEFSRAISDLKKDLPSLSDISVSIRLLQITASVGDGHTYVHLPSNMKHYPFSVYAFGKDFYVIRATADYNNALGKKLVRINGLSVNNAVQKLSAIISKEQNEQYIMFNTSIDITIPEILYTLGIVPDPVKAKFTFADEKGEELELELPAIDPAAEKWVSVLKEAALFQQRLSENFWFTYLEDINAVYVNFKNYDNLAENARNLFDFVDEKKATRMIIDLRQNGGGDYLKGRRQLLSRVKENNTINQKGNLFVVTGRRTFSAAMVNSIDFKKETNATIIGEPPGGRPNEYSENDEMKLPNSGLIISYSTRYYKFLDNDLPAFEPDIRVDPNWKDFSAGIDPVLQMIKTIIQGKR